MEYISGKMWHPLLELAETVMGLKEERNMLLNEHMKKRDLKEYAERVGAIWDFACRLYETEGEAELVIQRPMEDPTDPCGWAYGHLSLSAVSTKENRYMTVNLPVRTNPYAQSVLLNMQEYRRADVSDIAASYLNDLKLWAKKGAASTWQATDMKMRLYEALHMFQRTKTDGDKESDMCVNKDGKKVQECGRLLFWARDWWDLDSGETAGTFERSGTPLELLKVGGKTVGNKWLVLEEGTVAEELDGAIECIMSMGGMESERDPKEVLIELERLYREGRSNLPDKVFDGIMEAHGMTEEGLQAMCEERGLLPKHISSESVGIDSDKGRLVSCNVADCRILSQDKVRDVGKLHGIVRGWDADAVMSWKLDGCAVRLHYKGTKFDRAETKGKAKDVTEHMARITNFPKEIEHGRPVTELNGDDEWWVTGELVGWMLPRTVAAGYLGRKELDKGACETAKCLRFIAYDSNIHKYASKNEACSPIRLYTQMLDVLRTNGFDTVDTITFRNGGMIKSGEFTQLLGSEERYPTDGLVIRVNDIGKYNKMGATEHHPKGSVAFKFEDEWVKCRAGRFELKLGENGTKKIIAVLESPVEIGGKLITKACMQPRGCDILNGHDSANPYRREPIRLSVNGGNGWLKLEGGIKIEVCLRGCVIPMWRLRTE